MVKYYLPQRGPVILAIFGISGKKLETISRGSLKADYHRYSLNMADYASGVYVYQLEHNGVRVARKMTLIK